MPYRALISWSIRRRASPPYDRGDRLGRAEAAAARRAAGRRGVRTGPIDQEEQDHRLEDVDQLGRDPGLDLHQPGARAHRAEEQRREKMIPIGFDRASSATAIASKPTVVPKLSSSSSG